MAVRPGALPHPALELSALSLALRHGCIPIVLFNSESDVAHFSPLLGVRRGNVILPLADEEKLPMNRFRARWSEPGIQRQCVIAGTSS